MIAEAEPNESEPVQQIFYWEYARSQQQNPYWFYRDLACGWHNLHTEADRNVLYPDGRAWLDALLAHEREIAEQRWQEIKSQHGL